MSLENILDHIVVCKYCTNSTGFKLSIVIKDMHGVIWVIPVCDIPIVSITPTEINTCHTTQGLFFKERNNMKVPSLDKEL